MLRSFTIQLVEITHGPATEKMINPTGHAEIDQQHELLDTMVEQLAIFCSEARTNPEITCNRCTAAKQQHCRHELGNIVDELTAFLIGHAAYEEKMMDLLPNSPSCQAHVKAHKVAHEGIAKQLKKLSAQASRDSPRAVGNLMWRLIGDWLGNHSALFDHRLVRLGKSISPEISFDDELVIMLDQHVFPNRPTQRNSSSGKSQALRRMKLEVRGRFESLSPAQRAVFWLVIGGKKNAEIACELTVSVNTVKTHRAAIFQKMDVSSVVELVKKADVLR
jgi:DNA-binding CsgD family transcriptional regulator/hemerythrin